MPKLVKDKNGYYRIAISPDMVRLFDLKSGREYDWINSGGFPALQERKE